MARTRIGAGLLLLFALLVNGFVVAPVTAQLPPPGIDGASGTIDELKPLNNVTLAPGNHQPSAKGTASLEENKPQYEARIWIGVAVWDEGEQKWVNVSNTASAWVTVEAGQTINLVTPEFYVNLSAGSHVVVAEVHGRQEIQQDVWVTALLKKQQNFFSVQDQ